MNNLIHLTVAFKKVGPRRQGPPWNGQNTHWIIMRKSTLPEIKLDRDTMRSTNTYR